MEHHRVLPDLLALVRPLYQRMEPLSFAADAAKARREQAKVEERVAKEEEALGDWARYYFSAREKPHSNTKNEEAKNRVNAVLQEKFNWGILRGVRNIV